MRTLVVGLGRFGGGVGVTRWLASKGASVTVTDQAPAESLAESVSAIRDLHVGLELGSHTSIDRRRFDLVVVSPAVRPNSDIHRQLIESGVSWTTEINLFCERCPAAVVAVTGSYGKSTTCAMMAHALQAAISREDISYREVFLGGNIGGSLLSELHRMTPDDIVVLELSNAQLENTPRIAWTPALAVITNIHPHHLDRYASFDDYARTKLNVLGVPRRTRSLVLGPVHERVAPIVAEGVQGVEQIARPGAEPALQLKVAGSHNLANAACVLAACELLAVNRDRVAAGLADFRGLPHRLEYVRTIGGVDYINDSKSTAPQATVTALRALAENKGPTVQGERPGTASAARSVVLILGGQSKPEPMDDLPAEVNRTCKAAICLGECGLAYANAICSAANDSHARTLVETTSTLDEALRLATRYASPGGTVLFSPGAPSFDRYVNFAERGQHFVRLVNVL
jgi:UDP-N-acetylmuramoylalanine--D-glutamate ligase